jgi:hypothetical protein
MKNFADYKDFKEYFEDREFKGYFEAQEPRAQHYLIRMLRKRLGAWMCVFAYGKDAVKEKDKKFLYPMPSLGEVDIYIEYVKQEDTQLAILDPLFYDVIGDKAVMTHRLKVAEFYRITLQQGLDNA